MTADFLSPIERSERMSRIRSTNTDPELVVRRFLHGKGLRYRLHKKDLPGRPDLVFPKYNAVVFVQGCFWHAHTCQKGRIPSTRPSFWRLKFEANKKRDRRNARVLARLGWRVICVWECQLSGASRRASTLSRVFDRIIGKR
jgi:DNA mismatch endonuclease, patch repair protein